MTARMKPQTIENMFRVLTCLRNNPWKTRKQVGDALDLNEDEIRRLFQTHLDLRSRPAYPNRQKPLVHALPVVDPLDAEVATHPDIIGDAA